MSLKILFDSAKTIFHRFLKVEEMDFIIPEKNTGIKRFVIKRPGAAAILILNKSQNTFVLIRQFRAPVFATDNDGWILEVPAGVLEPGETPEKTIIREALEETGYRITTPVLMKSFYSSPGLMSEMIHLFYAEVNDDDKIEKGGGLDEEHEFLEVLEIPVNEAFEMIKDGRIVDGKTIIAIQQYEILFKKQ